MATCDDGLAVLLPHLLLLVLPIGLPLAGLGWVAHRRGSRAASVGQLLVAAVFFATSLLLAPRLEEARAMAVAFVPPLAAAALASWKPARGTRLAALLAAFVPPLVVQAWSVGQALATTCGAP